MNCDVRECEYCRDLLKQKRCSLCSQIFNKEDITVNVKIYAYAKKRESHLKCAYKALKESINYQMQTEKSLKDQLEAQERRTKTTNIRLRNLCKKYKEHLLIEEL